jgi:hypothetical protein
MSIWSEEWPLPRKRHVPTHVNPQRKIVSMWLTQNGSPPRLINKTRYALDNSENAGKIARGYLLDQFHKTREGAPAGRTAKVEPE